LKRIVLGFAVAGVVVPLAGCDRSGGSSLSSAEQLEASLRPAPLAAALKKLPGAHLSGSTLFRVAPAARKSGEAGDDAVTTKTELWLDRHGQYRLVESNDREGGREAVLYGRELAVAIKPGKMIKRAAQEPEPTRLLEEAVSGPWAAWETVRRFATVERAGDVLRLGRSAKAVPVAASFAETTPLRRWRDTISVKSLEGEVRLDPKTGVPLAFDLKATFTATREDKVALAGEIAVSTRLDGVGSTPVIAAPLAEALPQRQRTILEERALLGRGEAPKEAR
jgi:hypothetical protein